MRQRTGRKNMDESGTSEPDDNPELGHAGAAVEDPDVQRKKTRATFFLRMWMTFLMIGLFLGVLSLGHFAVVVEICIMQVFVFRELLNVRYNHAKERDIPWFRSVHWSLFFACTFYANGVPVLRFISDCGVPLADTIIAYHMLICFVAYAALLVAVVLSLKKHHYRYQMGQLTWTALVLVIVVLQTRLIVYNIFSGLIWFFLPASLVTCNDCFAYFSGLAFGKRFFSTPFLALSPKKTWEGFIGALVATVLFSFFWPLLLAQFPFLTCPYHNLACVPDPMFSLQAYALPSALLAAQSAVLSAPLVSQVWIAPIQLHSVCLALVASVIAPFGGFFASGIKRAYGIKDFDSVIPGHGGFMDRLDCQFVIGTYTFVHLTTFSASASGSVTAVVSAFSALPREAQVEALRRIVEAASVESVLPTAVLRSLETALSS